MGNKYYIKFGISNRKNAGSKAMKDVMHLLDSEGYQAMPALPVTANKVIKLLIDIPLLVLVVLFFVRTRGTVIYVIPSNAFRVKLLALLHRLLGFRLICFINDVEQLRMTTSTDYAKEEMKSIAAADCILAPNEQSIHILKHQFDIHQPMIAVGVWDYLSEYIPTLYDEKQTGSSKEIAYAGNLKKSPFIYSLGAVPLHFTLWGEGAEQELPENVGHQGAVTPDELPPLLNQCAWGLVWDGPLIETCDGPLGTYLRFNNAHKCGLYLAAGLPLIVWKESGMAHFVESHGIGIGVESLTGLPDALASITPERYQRLRQNVMKEGKLIRSGHYFLSALHLAERKNLTLMWRKLQPMEAGKDVILVPKYLGDALGYHVQVVCGYNEETIRKMPEDCVKQMDFIKRPLTFQPKQRIPVYVRYLLGHARQTDLLMCFHRKPETFVNLLLYKCLNWKGKVYVKLDTEAGKEWSLAHKKGLKRWMHHLMNLLFLHCCNAISCETEQGFQYLTEESPYTRLFSKKLVILPNAFDEETLQSLKLTERCYREKENLMITVGRIGTAQKNTEMLLDAIKKVNLKEWRLCLIGSIEPNFQPVIEKLYDEHPQLNKRVTFVGPIYDKAELWEWYNRSRVFVLTSTWESYGIVLTEAQRFRNYLVSTDVGGASSLIRQGKYGVLVPQNDSETLAHELQAIVNQTTEIDVYKSNCSPVISYEEAIKPLAIHLTE